MANYPPEHKGELEILMKHVDKRHIRRDDLIERWDGGGDADLRQISFLKVYKGRDDALGRYECVAFEDVREAHLGLDATVFFDSGNEACGTMLKYFSNDKFTLGEIYRYTRRSGSTPRRLTRHLKRLTKELKSDFNSLFSADAQTEDATTCSWRPSSMAVEAPADNEEVSLSFNDLFD